MYSLSFFSLRFFAMKVSIIRISTAAPSAAASSYIPKNSVAAANAARMNKCTLVPGSARRLSVLFIRADLQFIDRKPIIIDIIL